MDTTPTITPIFKDVGEYAITLLITVFLFVVFIVMTIISIFLLQKPQKFTIGKNLIYLITLLLLTKIVYNIYQLSKYTYTTDQSHSL